MRHWGAVLLGSGIVFLVSCTKSVQSPEKPVPTECVDEMARRIVEQAKLIPAGSKTEKSAIYDLVFPLTPDQAEASNQTAILGVQIVARDSKMLPVRRIVVANEGPEPMLYSLPGIFQFYPVKVLPPTDPVAVALGSYTQTMYFFLPLRFLRQPSELYLILKDGETRFKIARFPNAELEKALPEFLKSGKILKEDEKKIPDPAWVIPAVNARYCLDR